MQKLPEGDEYTSQLPVGLHSWFSIGVYSLLPTVASYWPTPPGFDDITCLYIHIHTYYGRLAVEVNGSKFIIQSGSRQIQVHLLLYYHFTLWEFLTSALADGLSLEFEWQQISSSHHNSSQPELTNAVVWIFSSRPLIFKSTSSFSKLLVTVPRVPITTRITVTFMFHSFYLSFHFFLILLCGQLGQQSPQFSKSLFLF